MLSEVSSQATVALLFVGWATVLEEGAGFVYMLPIKI